MTFRLFISKKSLKNPASTPLAPVKIRRAKQKIKELKENISLNETTNIVLCSGPQNLDSGLRSCKMKEGGPEDGKNKKKLFTSF